MAEELKQMKTISLNHVNVRQSIYVMLAKLVLIDFLTALLILAFYIVVAFNFINLQNLLTFVYGYGIYFSILALLKVIMTIYLVLEWVNNYYEIDPEHIFHKQGLILRKIQRFELSHVRAIKLEQGAIGEIFNCGSITFYDRELRTYITMYAIHNPQRYMKVLAEVLPNANVEMETSIHKQTNNPDLVALYPPLMEK